MDHPRNPRPDAPAPSTPDASSTPDAAPDAPDDAPAPSDVAAPAAPADVAEPGAAASRDEPRRHDQTYKLLFSQPLAARSLIEDVLARDWSDELDLDTLERFPTEHVDAGLHRSMSDMAWRVWFKGRKRSVVFLVEFQSSVDPSMAMRMLQYATAAAKFLHENPGLLDAGGFMPLLAAYELYTGPGRSTAKRSMAELCKLPEVPPAVQGKIASFPSYTYPGVDLQRLHGEGLLAEGTVVEWLGAVERDLIAHLPRLQPGMAARLGDPEHQALREALAAWTDERLRVLGATPEKREHIREAILNPRERPEMAQTFQEWEAEAREKGRAEARAEARVDQRHLVVRLASRRFGAVTGERLAELVEPMGPEELVHVGDAVVDSGTGEELLERASNGVSSKPPN